MFRGVRSLVAATFFFAALNLNANLTQSNSFWGTYIWSGLLSSPSPLPDSVELVASHGFQSLRLVFSPLTFGTYSLKDSLGCGSTLPVDFLSCLSKTPSLAKILGDPRLKTIMLTTYDAISWGNGAQFGFLDDAFLVQNESLIIESYARFVESLAISSGGQTKTVIVSNWEGDNQVYCGSAYGYLSDAAFRAECQKKYLQGSIGSGRSTAEGLRGLRHWFEIRQTGIALGRSRIAAKYPNLQVIHAPEFNMVHLLNDQGFGDVLRSGLPVKAKPDAVSYSSYESINEEILHPGSFSKSMTQMRVELVKQGLTKTPVILGEVGFPSKIGDTSGLSATHMRKIALLIQENKFQFQIDHVYFWQAVDEPSGSELFGLFDRVGQPKLFSALKDIVLHQ